MVITKTKRLVACPQCPKTFKAKKNVDLHVINEHTNLKRTLTKCHRLMANKQKAESHDKDCTNDDSVKCHICGMCQKTLRFLKRHLTLTHKVSANMTEHQIKLRSKTKQSIYIDCDFDEQCTYHSKDYNEVLKHLENDHGLVEKKEKVNCDICEKVFIFVDDFKSHFNTKHNNSYVAVGVGAKANR